MAYLFADPIARVSETGTIVPVDTPLDLEAEYQSVIDNLKATGKQFTIIKEAVNY
jgi:hypothetical protein